MSGVMKKSRKSRLLYICGYTAFVVLLLLGTRCESRVHLTTPERDAKHIAELAELAHSEAELKVVEKMRANYEEAYRRSYGGAKALYFRTLVDPILDEAGDRREEYANAEAYLAEQQAAFNNKLRDMDKAWKMELGSDDDVVAAIERNDATIEAKSVELEALVAEKEQLAIDIVDAGYPESMLNAMGDLEAKIEAKSKEIANVEYSNTIIRLAYRLQRGKELVIAEPEPEVEVAEEVM